MTSQLIYQYPPLMSGILLKRYQRFFADIELTSGEIITAHCPNTGPMTDVCIPGSLVQVSKSDNPKRKLAYTWEMIKLERTWVGVNTNLPNRVVKLALERQLFPELADSYTQILPEVIYGKNKKSRVDFFLPSSQKNIYLEVKNVTWAQGKLALFPDTVTTRGQKHLQELVELLPEFRSVMLYFINRSDCTSFAPGEIADPVYGELLRQAIARGLEVLPLRFEVTPKAISYLGKADLLLQQPDPQPKKIKQERELS
ncbi:DNA/RNA nuclease SfsA [Oscillatoria salina]|uniref:DNA/RNA nuclease SfsA n=1 Tax=Oscillatoria salina TaxID=331517 RepID=UPI001CCA50F7|nr:DNA/RNA nuclease SfsA [Oscillatoria salina]MBZ8179899.1 DNA/RNA nuclease SfsA [Oscillatoria salina IIICB1]